MHRHICDNLQPSDVNITPYLIFPALEKKNENEKNNIGKVLFWMKLDCVGIAAV